MSAAMAGRSPGYYNAPMSTDRSTLRLGTRGSLLARLQSQQVADLLAPHFPGSIALEIITTAGDRDTSRSLTASGGKGLFVKEIEEALLEGRIDLAVHSAKDMPAEIPPGLRIACTPRRELPNDVWIGYQGQTIAQLPPGARVGTTSLRRQAQLLAMRPNLQTCVFRGNIDTRLRKVAAGPGADGLGVYGTFLAAAGLRRAGLMPTDARLLPTDQFIPAAGQGTLAVECRAADAPVVALLQKIHDQQTYAALTLERQVVQAFAASCLAPIGVCAEPRGVVDEITQHGWIARAIIATPDGKASARAALLTDDPTPEGLATLRPLLIETLERRGARGILAQVAAGQG